MLVVIRNIDTHVVQKVLCSKRSQIEPSHSMLHSLQHVENIIHDHLEAVFVYQSMTLTKTLSFLRLLGIRDSHNHQQVGSWKDFLLMLH